MVERVNKVSNPLTIVAIFAALAEVAGTVSISLLPLNIQNTFIWFMMLFPTLLIIFFFLTLNFNHTVLYSPSDYSDESNFLKTFKSEMQIIDQNSKIVRQINDIKQELTTITANVNEEQVEQVKSSLLEKVTNVSSNINTMVTNVINEVASSNKTHDTDISRKAQIIKYLHDKGEVGFSEIISDLGLPKSTIGYNLAALEKKGLVKKNSINGENYYSIN